MTRLVKLAAEVQAFLDARLWQNCLIGGLVMQRWGEVRLTKDVDLTLLAGFGHEDQFVDALLGQYRGRRVDAREFALRYRVVLLQSEDGIGIDISLGALPFEEEIMRRASWFDYLDDVRLRTCSAEDFVVLKAFANRDQDWLDLESVLVRQGERLDWTLIRRELPPLCDLKDAPDIPDRLEKTRRKIANLN